jgi:hypothetical protein
VLSFLGEESSTASLRTAARPTLAIGGVATTRQAERSWTEPAERLAAVEHRITRAKARIVRQEVLVARLAAAGGEVSTGRALLEELRSTLAEMYARRRRILRRIEAGSR